MRTRRKEKERKKNLKPKRIHVSGPSAKEYVGVSRLVN
jgi:hypothetical protein